MKILLVLSFCIFCAALKADDTRDQLVEELGLPKEITITKKAVALIAWSGVEKNMPIQSAERSCLRVRMLHERQKKFSAEKRERWEVNKINPEIPMDACEAKIPFFNRQCRNLARQYFVKHHIAGTVAEASVVKTLTFLVSVCPIVKMLGQEVNPDKIYKNIEKAQ